MGAKLIKKVPVIPIRDVSLVPSRLTPLHISRSVSVKAYNECVNAGISPLFVLQKDKDSEDVSGSSDLHGHGVIGRVLQSFPVHNDAFKLIVEGVEVCKIISLTERDGFFEAECKVVTPHYRNEERMQSVFNVLMSYLLEYERANPALNKDLISTIRDLDNYELISYLVTEIFKPQDQQKIIETSNLYNRFKIMCELLKLEIEFLEIDSTIRKKVSNNMARYQKEYFLQEQLKVIRGELGTETDDPKILNFYKIIKSGILPKHVEEKLTSDVDRLAGLQSGSAEAGVLYSYVEFALSLPWGKLTNANFDVVKASKVLERDHYGIDKVKAKILEHISYAKVADRADSTIICLVGPPGVGKTTLATSIANSFNRKFVKISLGGSKDEAEIRGHRKTYIGAMPGKIISAFKKAESMNPVILLDEIDKLAKSYNGDPASALLEVLDPQGNRTFVDHYVEFEFDLSNVFFIATANNMYDIPAVLRDRMEIINISSYSEFEKIHIAKKHLIPKYLRSINSDIKFNISESAIKSIIRDYTSESGVRELSRRVLSVIKRGLYLAETGSIDLSENKKIVVNASNLNNFIDDNKYTDKFVVHEDRVGLVTGLAYTSVGGSILQFEAVRYSGKGALKLTGNLGQVMKESAEISFSVAKSICGTEYNIASHTIQNSDIHLHVPAGATPKDGPSAGITMTAALVSVLTGRKVRSYIAMTGEINLRGMVMRIGGLREKILAARRAGLSSIIVPIDNKHDYTILEGYVKDGLNVHFVETISDVLDIVLI